jgi:hypothetical protein
MKELLRKLEIGENYNKKRFLWKKENFTKKMAEKFCVTKKREKYSSGKISMRGKYGG